MRRVLMNSGQAVEAAFSDENVRDIFLPLLERWTALRREKGRRVVALLAAPPGAGKSTLAALLEALSRQTPGLEAVTALGMDGFHMKQAYLLSHTVERDGQTIPMARIKGAPETFDLDGLRAALQRVAAGEDCPWPRYDRTLHDPVDDGPRVTGPIALVEGNYLLLDEPGWRELRACADDTVSISAGPEQLRKRLLARHLSAGKSPEAAAAMVASDLVNAKRCLERSAPANLALRLLPDGTFERVK